MIRFRFLTLKAYMAIISGIRNLEHLNGKPYDFDNNWSEFAISRPISVKTADIVIYDRHMDKWK